MLLTTQEQVKRWEEHFYKIFNKDDNSRGRKQEMRNVEEEEEEDNSENENEAEVNFDLPTKIKIQLSLSQLKNGKAASLGNIYREYKKVTLK